jgi:hypothetical protein
MVVSYILRAYQSGLFIILLETIRILENAAVFNSARTLVGQCIKRRKGIQKRPLFPDSVFLLSLWCLLTSSSSLFQNKAPSLPFFLNLSHLLFLLCGNSALSSTTTTTTIHTTTPIIPRALPPCLTSTSTLTRPYLTYLT